MYNVNIKTTIDMNTDKKTKKPYSTTYHATYMRNKRANMIKKDPLHIRKCVWVVETADNKQIAFLNRKDIQIRRIPKSDLRSDHMKAF